MKNTKTCPKCGGNHILRVEDNGGVSLYLGLLSRPPGGPIRLHRLRLCGELGGRTVHGRSEQAIRKGKFLIVGASLARPVAALRQRFPAPKVRRATKGRPYKYFS